MKKLGLKLSVTGLSLVLFASGAAMAAEKPTVNYWSRKSGPDHIVVQKMVDFYNKVQSKAKVKVQFLTWGGAYYGKIRSSILSGNPPELFDVAAYAPPMFYNNVESFSADDLAKMGINVSDYVQSAWDVVKHKGKYYGTVNAILPLGLYYNKDMFKEAGLDPNKPPTNLDEFVAYAKKLTRDTNGDGKIDQWGTMLRNSMNSTLWEWEGTMVQNGGMLLNKEMTKANFNNKLGIDALNQMLDYSRKYKIAPTSLADAWKAFAAKKVAMIFSGPWMIRGFKGKVNFGTAMMPQFGSVRPAAWASLDIYFFPKGMRKDKEKWKATMDYAGWVAGDEGMKFYAQMFVPTQLKMLKSPTITKDPYMAAFAKAAETGGIYFPQANKAMQEIYGVIWSSLQAAFAGKITPEEALSQAEEQTNIILAR